MIVYCCSAVIWLWKELSVCGEMLPQVIQNVIKNNNKMLPQVIHNVIKNNDKMLPQVIHNVIKNNNKMLPQVIHNVIKNNNKMLPQVIHNVIKNNNKMLAQVIHNVIKNCDKMLPQVMHNVIIMIIMLNVFWGNHIKVNFKCMIGKCNAGRAKVAVFLSPKLSNCYTATLKLYQDAGRRSLHCYMWCFVLHILCMSILT